MRLLPTLAVALMIAAAPTWAAAKTVTVVIEDLKYKPAEVVIQPGDTVVWVNNDDRDHTVTSDDGSFKSGRLGSGKRYERKFDRAGKFSYGDDYFGRMRGTVVVREGK